MGRIAEAKVGVSVEVLSALLRRCLESLDPGESGFERDVETAMESDAVLVADIKSAIAS